MECLGPVRPQIRAEPADALLKAALVVLEGEVEDVALLAWFAQAFGPVRHGQADLKGQPAFSNFWVPREDGRALGEVAADRELRIGEDPPPKIVGRADDGR